MLPRVVWYRFTDVLELLLVMVAASTSETSVNFYQTIRLNISEDIFILSAVRT
jgi:hypothetical protein